MTAQQYHRTRMDHVTGTVRTLTNHTSLSVIAPAECWLLPPLLPWQLITPNHVLQWSAYVRRMLSFRSTRLLRHIYVFIAAGQLTESSVV